MFQKKIDTQERINELNLKIEKNKTLLKRVLIPCDMGIGNLIMYLPALKSIKEASDELKVTVIVSSKYEVNLKLLKEITPDLIDNSIIISNQLIKK